MNSFQDAIRAREKSPRTFCRVSAASPLLPLTKHKTTRIKLHEFTTHCFVCSSLMLLPATTSSTGRLMEICCRLLLEAMGALACGLGCCHRKLARSFWGK